MNRPKFDHLQVSCQQAVLFDNIEKCLELLIENIEEGQGIYSNILLIGARLNRLLQDNQNGTINYEQYTIGRNKIRADLLDFINITLKESHVSLLRRINDRILIIACKNSPTKWKKLFNEAFFSHVSFIVYKDDIPDDFKNPDVVIFDDLECGGKSASFMGRYIEETPKAHILYVGKENPLEEDNPVAYKRCANANSEITILARLRELLEYRKVYGLPDE